MNLNPYYLLFLLGLARSQYTTTTYLPNNTVGYNKFINSSACLTNPSYAQQLISAQDMAITSQQFTMVFWVMIQSTTNNYGYIRSLFQFNPNPSVSSHVLSLGYTPSTLELTSCTSNIACNTMFIQVDSRRMIGSWAQITLSLDVENQLRIFVKVIYTNLLQLATDSNLQVDVNQTSFTFKNSNLYDFIPYNQFNVQPLCGQLKGLRLIQGLFTNDQSLNLDLQLNYLVYLPLLTLPATQVVDQLNSQLLFNIYGSVASSNKGFHLKSKAYMAQQAPPFGNDFTIAFWMKASSMSLLSPVMPIIQRQTSGNTTTFLLQAQFASKGINLLVSFNGQTAQTHGLFQLDNNVYYRVVLSCYYNYNLQTYVFSLFVTNAGNTGKPYQSLFVNSNGLLPQNATDLLVFGDSSPKGLKPWATTDYINIFDVRIFDGFSQNYPGERTSENCFVSVGTYPRHCLVCASTSFDPYKNCAEASAFDQVPINYCAEGSFWYEGLCQQITVAHCSRGSDVSTCLVCLYGYTLSSNICTLKKPSLIVNYTCSNGGSRCEFTENSTQQNIIQCTNKTLYAKNSISTSTCTTGCPSLSYYKNTYAKTCNMCDPSCDSCFGTKNNECNSCSTATTTYYYEGQCRPDCPAGLFPDSTTHSCSGCDKSCTKCLDRTTTNCQACYYQYYLDGSTCKTACPAGKFANYATNLCSSCDPTVKTCFGGDPGEILSCSNYVDMLTRTCQASCPLGYFSVLSAYSGVQQCQPCFEACAACTDATNNNCQKCALVYGIQNYLSGTTCVLWCPTNMYADQPTGTCIACDASCLTCFGAANNQCIKCSATTTPPNYFYLGTCVATCPSGFYGESNNPQNALCLVCGLACAQCSDYSTTKCSSCVAPAVLTGTACTSICANGFFDNPTNSDSCDACPAACATCIGVIYSTGLLPLCLTCPSGMIYYLYGCIATCPSSTYLTSDKIRCMDCPLECSICQAGSSTQCTACNPPYFLDGTTCSVQCSALKFRDYTTNLCQACDTSCTSCDGPTYEDCATCASNLYYYAGQCVKACPTGYFLLQNQNVCIICHSHCSNCTDATPASCQGCATGFFLYQAQCMVACPPNYYPDSGSQVCNACDKGCILCAASSTSCSLCATGYKFYPPDQCLNPCPVPLFTYTDIITSIDYCAAACPVGYVAIAATYTCLVQTFAILMLGINRMYPIGASVAIQVIAVDLLTEPDLQAHGFQYTWACSALKSNTTCKTSKGADVVLPTTSYINLNDLQTNDVLAFTVFVKKGLSSTNQTGAIMMSKSLSTISTPFNYCTCTTLILIVDPQPYLNQGFAIQANSNWGFDLNPGIAVNTLILIYKNTTLGTMNVTGKSKFTLHLQSFTGKPGLLLNSNDLYFYFYPQGVLRKIKINFPPVQPQLKAQPNVYVVPLFTAVNVTFGLQNHSYTEISYTLYMYTDATLKDTDIASSTFDNGIQLLYGAPTGWVVIYPPVGDACYFVCLAVDVSGAFSLTQRNVSLYGQSYPSILSAIQNIMTLWNAHIASYPQNKVLILTSFVYSLDYLLLQTFCSPGNVCSGNGVCDQNQMCQCQIGFYFKDCSGGLDDAISYNQYLIDILLQLQVLQKVVDLSNPAYFQQIQSILTFLLKNADLVSVYYNLQVEKITLNVLSILDTSLKNIILAQSSNSIRELDFSIAVATQISSATSNFINLQRITNMLNQVLLFTSTLRTEISDNEIDLLPSRFVNISTIKSKTVSIMQQIQNVVLKTQELQPFNYEIKSSGISFYAVTTSGQQLVNFFAGLMNFSSLLHQPDNTYNQTSSRRRMLSTNQSFSLQSVFDAQTSYILLQETIKYNSYSFKNNFYYPSAAYPYISFRFFDTINYQEINLQNQQALNQSITIWFPTSDEFDTTRRLQDYGGEYVCAQQDVNQNWQHKSCSTKYVSVFYVICTCNTLNPITLVEDYQYLILPNPVYPPELLPIEVMIYVWIPIGLLWVLGSFWGNFQDQEQSAESIIKKKEDNEKLKRASLKRYSIGINDNMAKNLVGPDGKILMEAFSIEEMVQLQRQFGDAMFTNINIMPPENINGAYVPDAAMNRKVDIMDDQVDRMVRIVDILKTHTLIGAIFKYKLTTSRVFRLTLIFQRTYIILLFTGLFVTQGFPNVSVACLLGQIFAVLYRLIEQMCKETVKSSNKNNIWGSLHRLILVVSAILFIGLLTFLFAFQLVRMDNYYVEDWALALGSAIIFDQCITEFCILAIRLYYRQKMKNVKLTQKFQFNQVKPELIQPPSQVYKKVRKGTYKDSEVFTPKSNRTPKSPN